MWSWLPLQLLACAAYGGADPPRPIVVVSLDTLRADRLGAWGNQRGLTPNLDRFAREAVVFREAYATSDITLLSHASLFTSRYPSELGPTSGAFRLSEKEPTLAAILSLYGVKTAAFTGGGHLTRGGGLDRGFSTFEVPQEIGSLWHTAVPSIKWFEQAGPRSFLFLHSYDAHAPYLKPAPAGLGYQRRPPSAIATLLLRSRLGTEQVYDGRWFRGHGVSEVLDVDAIRPWGAEARAEIATRGADLPAVSADDAAVIVDAYDAAVAYADGLFGWWLTELERQPYGKDAVVIVLSDHGESLGEDGLFGHGLSLHAQETHVPLMIRVPGAEPRVVDGLVSLLDVMPTVLDLAGATVPAEARGRSLMPWVRGEQGPQREAVFSQGTHRMVSVHTSEDELVISGLSADSPFFSDMLSLAALTGPLFSANDGLSVERRGALRDDLVGWHRDLPLSVAPGTNPAMVERMRAEGYWESR